MKKIVILGIIFTTISILSNFYITNYYCAGDDYCLGKLGDGVTENLVYLSLTFLSASLISLIAQKKIWWISIFVITSVITLSSSQTCDSVSCFNRDTLLVLTIILTILAALITNLLSRFRK